jgi:hypothetical protein
MTQLELREFIEDLIKELQNSQTEFNAGMITGLRLIKALMNVTIKPYDYEVSSGDVYSSIIKTFSWKNGELRITFQSGKVYKYDGVSINLYNEFVQSPSYGKFFNARIKPKFKGELVED